VTDRGLPSEAELGGVPASRAKAVNESWETPGKAILKPEGNGSA